MTEGPGDNGAAMAGFQRPCRCHSGPCKCCCLQEVKAEIIPGDPDMATAKYGTAELKGKHFQAGEGKAVGGIRENFYCCVPTYEVYKADSSVEYDLHMPTCCGGCMINPCAQGCCNCRVPFYLYEPGSGTEIDAAGNCSGSSLVGGHPKAQITKLWTGLGQELFTDADTFEVKCPEAADVETKVRLIGATLLLNQLYFERDKGEDGD